LEAGSFVVSKSGTMKQMQSSQLLDQLEADTKQIILTLHYLLQEDPGVLTQQPAAGKWSVAQVAEHLNSYGRYYLPLIQQGLKQSTYPANASFKPGWLGDYFVKSMLPKEDGRIPNKMNAPKNHRPSPYVDSFTVLNEFMNQEKLLLELLQQARNSDLNKIRIPISIAKFIKIKLGDTFRFLIAHHQRHFVQVSNTLQAVRGNHGYTFPSSGIAVQ
jgi:hypothetical protein